eukprot:scaffold138368_cov615-Phaeocystis_antarctica.AAC.1
MRGRRPGGRHSRTAACISPLRRASCKRIVQTVGSGREAPARPHSRQPRARAPIPADKLGRSCRHT